MGRPTPTLALPALSLLVLAACSSSGGPPASTPGPDADAAPVDGSLGPVYCGVPLPSTCPATAPCAFATWGCAQAPCDGYYVVTDGAWNYYYSWPGGELAGEVSAVDASFIACPYGFQPPASCVPAVAGECSADAGPALDAAPSEDAPNTDATAVPDAEDSG